MKFITHIPVIYASDSQTKLYRRPVKYLNSLLKTIKIIQVSIQIQGYIKFLNTQYSICFIQIFFHLLHYYN
jgi:hypothetical protein